MQSEGKLPAGTPKKYPNAIKAYTIIARWVGSRRARWGAGGRSGAVEG